MIFKIIRKIRKVIFLVVFLGVLLLVGSFVYTVKLIKDGVSEQCAMAQESYEGDCTEAMLMKLSEEKLSTKDFNSLVWALGQLSDEKALDKLKELYESNTVSDKYELSKAIKLLEGGINITKLIWKR